MHTVFADNVCEMVIVHDLKHPALCCFALDTYVLRIHVHGCVLSVNTLFALPCCKMWPCL